MTVRGPKDDEERFKALLAILNGRGRSIAEVIEELTGEAPSEETVEAVKNRFKWPKKAVNRSTSSMWFNRSAIWQAVWA